MESQSHPQHRFRGHLEKRSAFSLTDIPRPPRRAKAGEGAHRGDLEQLEEVPAAGEAAAVAQGEEEEDHQPSRFQHVAARK